MRSKRFGLIIGVVALAYGFCSACTARNTPRAATDIPIEVSIDRAYVFIHRDKSSDYNEFDSVEESKDFLRFDGCVNGNSNVTEEALLVWTVVLSVLLVTELAEQVWDGIEETSISIQCLEYPKYAAQQLVWGRNVVYVPKSALGKQCTFRVSWDGKWQGSRVESKLIEIESGLDLCLKKDCSAPREGPQPVRIKIPERRR